jgi:hypothetical protein
MDALQSTSCDRTSADPQGLPGSTDAPPIGRASRLDPTRTRADRRKQHDTSLVSSSRSVAGNVGASAALAPPGPAPTPAI